MATGQGGSNTQAEAGSALARLAQPGERLIAAAAVVVLAVDLIAGFIIEEYNPGEVASLLALLALVVVFGHRFRDVAMPVPYGWLLAGLGLALGAVGVRWMLYEVLRNEILEADGATIVFALIFYAASIVALVGAWQLWRRPAT